MSTPTFEQLKTQFGDSVVESVDAVSPFIVVKAESIREIAAFLKRSGFDSLMCLSGVDTKGIKPPPAPKPAEGAPAPKPVAPSEELQVVYHLGSTSTGEKTALKVRLDRNLPHLPSVSSVWAVANWHEREAYDMFGIVFEGHPELTRILCPEDWKGWPLRKDYVFPQSWNSVPHARQESGAALADAAKTGKGDSGAH